MISHPTPPHDVRMYVTDTIRNFHNLGRRAASAMRGLLHRGSLRPLKKVHEEEVDGVHGQEAVDEKTTDRRPDLRRKEPARILQQLAPKSALQRHHTRRTSAGAKTAAEQQSSRDPRAQSQCKSAAQGDRTPARRLLRSNNPQEIQETQTGAAYQGRGGPTKFEPKMVQPTRPHIPHPTPPAPHPTPPAPHTPPAPTRSEISPPAHTHTSKPAHHVLHQLFSEIGLTNLPLSLIKPPPSSRQPLYSWATMPAASKSSMPAHSR
jgi:hypothetical protein